MPDTHSDKQIQTQANVTRHLLDGRRPSSVALHAPDRDYTYGELQEAVERFGAFLLRRHARKGDRAILIGENSFFWVSAYLAVLRTGLVCVPLPTSISESELKFILETTGAQIICMDAGCATKPGPALSARTLITDTETAPLPGAAAQISFPRILADHTRYPGEMPSTLQCDLAALMFTSGSTGTPRGVMVSHRNIIANTESIIRYLGLRDTDRIMTVLPFHYCYGASLLHTHLRVGASLVLEPRFLYPETLLERLAESKCTGFAGVPSHYQILLRNSNIRKKVFPCLRYVQQAGGPLAPAFVRELQQALPTTRIFIMYGQTEATARLSFLPPELLNAKIGSIGKGIPGTRLRVLDESGEDVEPGVTGEIVAEGGNIALGYWNEPEETASTFRNGRLHTGDLATVDRDGFIYIVGRARDFIKCGGERVGCRKLEEILLGCDRVMEAAVVGMPDPILGEAVKAVVVPSDASVIGENGASHAFQNQLLRYCKERLPASLVPKEIRLVDRLPKNSSGKVLKRALTS